jgi:hypothetical protein
MEGFPKYKSKKVVIHYAQEAIKASTAFTHANPGYTFFDMNS